MVDIRAKIIILAFLIISPFAMGARSWCKWELCPKHLWMFDSHLCNEVIEGWLQEEFERFRSRAFYRDQGTLHNVTFKVDCKPYPGGK